MESRKKHLNSITSCTYSVNAGIYECCFRKQTLQTITGTVHCDSFHLIMFFSLVLLIMYVSLFMISAFDKCDMICVFYCLCLFLIFYSSVHVYTVMLNKRYSLKKSLYDIYTSLVSRSTPNSLHITASRTFFS